MLDENREVDLLPQLHQLVREVSRLVDGRHRLGFGLLQLVLHLLDLHGLRVRVDLGCLDRLVLGQLGSQPTFTSIMSGHVRAHLAKKWWGKGGL